MAGARDVIRRAKTSATTKVRRGSSTGLPLETTEAIVKASVMNMGREPNAKDVRALARVTGQAIARIEEIIQTAKEEFHQSAIDYVRLHKKATEDAAAMISEDPKYADAALKASQWAIEKMSLGGKGVVESAKKAESTSGPKIMIGIKLGGEKVSAASAAYTVETDDPSP